MHVFPGKPYQNIVNGNMYQLDSKPNKSHYQKSNGNSSRNIQKFYHQTRSAKKKSCRVVWEWQDLPRLFGFAHLFRKKAPSLTKSRGTSRTSLNWSDILKRAKKFAWRKEFIYGQIAQVPPAFLCYLQKYPILEQFNWFKLKVTIRIIFI